MIFFCIAMTITVEMISCCSLKPRTVQNSALRDIVGTCALISFAGSASAAKGAFEMDAEYYLNNLFSGNKGEAAKTGIERRPIYKSARKVASSTSDAIVNEITDLAVDSSDTKVTREDILKQIERLRASKLPYFKTFAPIAEESLTDQYFLDITLYCLYQVAAKLIPMSQERVKFRTKVGEKVLGLFEGGQRYTLPASNQPSMQRVASSVTALLNEFKDKGVIASFQFDEEDVGDELFAKQAFEEKAPVSFQVTVDEPVTLLAFLEGQREDTFFHPEITGSSIVALLRKQGFSCKYEDYLLDNYYRDSNFDLRADAVILEISLLPAQLAPPSWAAFN